MSSHLLALSHFHFDRETGLGLLLRLPRLEDASVDGLIKIKSNHFHVWMKAALDWDEVLGEGDLWI